MTGNNKTVPEILAWMERVAAELLTGKGYPMTPIRFKCLCNELAEAVKRETVTKRNGLPVAYSETQSATRNAACVCQTAHNVAKLREALSAAGRAAREIQNVTEEADTAEVAISIAEICERALLFPARNCDGYEDGDDAFAAWHDSLKDGDVVGVRNAFKWLFAKAEKGCGHADAR